MAITVRTEPSIEPRTAIYPAAIRPPHVAERVVIVDGLPGCGKTLLSAIVGALERVEVEQYNYALEYACALHHLGKMTDDAAMTTIRLLTDVDLYDVMSAREVNFRWSDLSSAFKHVHPARYLRRLLLADGEAAMARIRAERPILHVVTHNLLAIGQPVAAALGERLVLVEVVRHPLYMLKQWFLYINRYGTDPRDFTVWIEHEGQALPWFAAGWEPRYLDAKPMDRVIYAIEQLGRLGRAAQARIESSGRSHVVTVPFERFVRDPWPWLRQFEQAMGTRVTAATRRMMRRQRVPRRMYAEGIGLSIYRANGWEPPAKGATEADECAARRAFAASHASPEALAVLDRLSREYEAAYLSRACG